MEKVQEQKLHEVGRFEFEVWGGGRYGRYNATRLTLDCDAIAVHGTEILLLSVVGAETSVKALTAGLRSSAKDQERVAYSAHFRDLNVRDIARAEDDYRIYRTKLEYGLWHVLCIAKTQGFMRVLTEQSVWQHLQSDRFTTPLLREWMPWLLERMKQRGIIVGLVQTGCEAGLLHADSETLDKLVAEGLQKGNLAINGHAVSRARTRAKSELDAICDLDAYMLKYGALLAKQAERSLEPLHVPGRDPLTALQLGRETFEAQAHVVEAARKALKRQNALLLVGEMGTGKTLMSMAAVQAHASGRPYRALVFCPGQLTGKWQREIEETIPAAEVFQIQSWKNLLHLKQTTTPTRAEWYIIARDRAKLGAKWQPAYLRWKHLDDGYIRCPTCGRRVVDSNREPLREGKPAHNGQAATGLWKRRSRCQWVLMNSRGKNDSDSENGDRLVEGCGTALWQMNGELTRYEPALFIKRHLHNFFEYLILDEIHEEKGADTAQGHAAGTLAAACKKVIALTGTLIGGYAEHLRPLLFRLSPRSLVEEGLGWSEVTAFNELYGRVETRITEKSGVLDEENRMSRGSKSTTKSVRPGIMPALFGRHLIDKAVFLGLSEVADNLPSLQEECVPVRMDGELAHAYREEVEKPLAEAIKAMMKRRDRRLLGAMLQTLLAYPDHPYGWEPVGYWDRREGGTGDFVTVATPPNLKEDVLRPKELALIDLVSSEKAQRRKVWVYVQYTDKHDVQSRLERILTQAGFNVGVLRTSVLLARREEWIAEHAPKLDVVISHPRLVETGLDLFDKAGGHNFPTLCFYETGYNLFTLRQASRRSWRIGQKESCRIIYLHYQDTMQDRAMALMGKKLTAAQALEGRFSSEGLVAMAGEDANVELALTRSLVERMDEGDARRIWSKVASTPIGAESAEQLGALPPVAPELLVLPIGSVRRNGAARQALASTPRTCAGMLF